MRVSGCVYVGILDPAHSLQRLRNLHYFLWVQAYGQEGGVARMGGNVPLSQHHYPWAKVVKQLPSSSLGKGVLDVNDIIINMPLSLCTILFSSGVSVGM